MILERFRLSCTTDYVVGEDGNLYRLPYIDAMGRFKRLKMILPFLNGRKNKKQPYYDLRIDGKVVKISKNQIIKYYVDIPKGKRKILDAQYIRPETDDFSQEISISDMV